MRDKGRAMAGSPDAVLVNVADDIEQLLAVLLMADREIPRMKDRRYVRNPS